MIITTNMVVYDKDRNSYKVLEEIGSGSFGCVYSIEKKSDKSKWALKTFLSEFPNEMTSQMFKNEGNQAMKVSHKNVIKYTFFHDGSQFEDLPPYIIMEYANQGTLKDLIDKQKSADGFLSSKKLKDIFSQLIDGMEAINSLLVHRDIKPDNILIHDGIMKISDFGLSKVVAESTRSGTFKGFGHLKFMSPEGWKDEKNTKQMDIYSMGIIFYELATLCYPYEVKNPDLMKQWEEAHLFQKPEIPKKINPDLPTTLNQLILKMMEKNVKERFENWDEIRMCLNEKELSPNEVSAKIEKMLEVRTEKDEEIKGNWLESQKRGEEIEEKIKIVKYQLKNEILNPLKDFINMFNENYQGTSKISLNERKSYDNISFRYVFHLCSGKEIELQLRVLLEEDFFKTERIETEIGRILEREVLNFPDYKNKRIMAWGYFTAESGEGFNLLLVEEKEGIYGSWYIVKNKNSGFHNRRIEPEPFAFDFDELEREIIFIGTNTIHIYDADIYSFDLSHFHDLIDRYNI